MDDLIDYINDHLNYIIAVIGGLTILANFLPFLGFDEEFVNGFQCALGGSLDYGGLEIEFVEFSPMNLAPILLSAGVVLFALINQADPNKFCVTGIFACAAIAAFCFFLTQGLSRPAPFFANIDEDIHQVFDLGIGAILAGILSVLSAIGGAWAWRVLDD